MRVGHRSSGQISARRAQLGAAAVDQGVMSARTSTPRGVIVAAFGALAALVSLWLPWYTIKLPDLFRGAFDKLGSGGASGAGTGTGSGSAADAMAGLFKGLASALPSEITGKGWQVMSGGDVALAVAAGAAMLLLAAVGGGFGSSVRIDRGLAGRLVFVAGLVVTGIAVYHVVSKPGAGAGSLSSIVTVKMGIWVATAAGLMMVAGGLSLGRSPRSAVVEPVAEPIPGAPAPFLPPVGSGVVAADSVATEPFATSEPQPAPIVSSPLETALAAPEPFATPEPYATPEPLTYAEAEPYVTPDPRPPYDAFTAPADQPPVPDWTGFSTSAPDPTAGEPASPANMPEPAAPRAAGVSIPPPGWAGAT
jgi:hypothetical protein